MSKPGANSQSVVLCEGYHDRAFWQAWLDGRPNAPSAGPKEHCWSYMAGWDAELGCEGFYAHLWKDDCVASELKKKLTAIGAWRVAELLTA